MTFRQFHLGTKQQELKITSTDITFKHRPHALILHLAEPFLSEAAPLLPKTLIVLLGYTILFSSFPTCGGSYLKRPRWWIIPLTTNPFATVERMSVAVGSPPGSAGASSSPLPEQLQAGPWIPHLIIHSVPSLGPNTPQQWLAHTELQSLLRAEREQLQAQMVSVYMGSSLCLSVGLVELLGICFLL